MDCTAEAGRYGIRAGLPLREATALCPSLVLLDERPARAARAAEALIDALGTVSPLVEDAAPGVVYADLRGLDGLYPRPGMVERAVLAAVPVGLPPRFAIADTKSRPTWRRAVSRPARRCASHRWRRPTSSRASPPLDGDAVERLRLFGIETVGAFAALPAMLWRRSSVRRAGRPGWPPGDWIPLRCDRVPSPGSACWNRRGASRHS